MPELPEVETIRRGLNATTCHQTIARGEVLLHRTIAYPPQTAEFLAGIAGCTIQEWQRRGKYLLARLQRGEQAGGWLGVHLRMTGQLLWVNPNTPLGTHTRLRMWFKPVSAETVTTESFQELRFVDIRTFGQVWWIPPDRLPESIITTLQHLGAEPLSADFSDSYLHQRLHRSQRSIKTALLDQSVVAGLGNIYVDECLFLSGLHPQRPAASLSPAETSTLVQAIGTVLYDSIAVGGTTLRDYRTVEGINGNYGAQAWVYRRTHEPCRRCATPIERIKLSGRSTHFCPQCQPSQPKIIPLN